ncbi:hypothetical protein F6R98_14180 [Candidatus Methylospira mobilis]|uniref:DUF2335 domain-containing protein n=1 Tax=Candidatus Methylospira mobilis TaxID=1808979 RepID=A0A5Q0BNE5_9GAMM|nr:hypothetical protein [Candidatus Methylospira mobilis]QFY43628.1 hypothetical protein F6R98_14180 [Candidatus Methylospira mobilis]WNV04616.1 hypothetical protein RP726_19825 [Candidatus Methylospira mobilis]
MVDLNTDLPDTEPQEILNGVPQPVVKGSSSRKSFAKLRRELSDEELSSPAVQRMLIDEIERLDSERIELASFRTKFHDSDKRAAILEERFKSKVSIEIIHVACITVGAGALGYAPSIWQTQPTAWMATIFGVVLIVAGLAAKAVKP